MLHNSQAKALDEFVANFDAYLHDRFGTEHLAKDEVVPQIVANVETARQEGAQKLTQSQTCQLAVMKKDKYRRELARQALDTEGLKAFAQEVLRGVDGVDLKSMAFDSDPDLVSSLLV